MKTLHLVLKHKWYDKIASGEKTSEYREVKPYWNKMFVGHDFDSDYAYPMVINREVKKYDTVVFHCGYSNKKTMEFKIDVIQWLIGEPNDLGLWKVWEIKLGERLK